MKPNEFTPDKVNDTMAQVAVDSLKSVAITSKLYNESIMAVIGAMFCLMPRKRDNENIND